MEQQPKIHLSIAATDAHDLAKIIAGLGAMAGMTAVEAGTTAVVTPDTKAPITGETEPAKADPEPKPRKKRRTKAEIEADKAAAEAAEKEKAAPEESQPSVNDLIGDTGEAEPEPVSQADLVAVMQGLIAGWEKDGKTAEVYMPKLQEAMGAAQKGAAKVSDLSDEARIAFKAAIEDLSF